MTFCVFSLNYLEFYGQAEMPLTPKGYCDSVLFFVEFVFVHKRAEMPLTPKGCCDEPFQEESLGLPFIYEN